MRVSKHNVPNYYDRNRSFNDAVAGLIQDIFQHQDVGSSGYIDARIASPHSTKPGPSADRVASGDDDLREVEARYDISGLGEYERRMFLRLVDGRYRTIVLRGDMGSGKSASINRVKAVLLRPRKQVCGLCKECGPVIIKMDFNKGYDDKDLNNLLREFNQDLYHQLRQQLKELFRRTDLVNSLRDAVLNNNVDYAAFAPFIEAYQDVAWGDIPKNHRVDKLFDYVQNTTNEGRENIRVLMSLVQLAKVGLNSEAGCLILIFDNIDSVLAEAQNEIMVRILSHQATAEAQALVVLRRGTNAKFGGGSASYAFGDIDHSGPDIKKVLVRRLSYYAEHWDSLAAVKAITRPAYRKAAKNRLDYILQTKDDSRGAIERVAPICGSSIRMGLFMCERFFLNSAVFFDEDPRYQDDIVRAVLVGDSETNEISAEDRCIANLLLNKLTGEASLINIRILQLVAEFKDDEASRTLRSLLKMLEAIGGWSQDECEAAFNYLLHLRRPLLWVDGRTYYEEITKKDLDDVMNMTEAGHFYLQDLLLDLVYVQEAALSVRWKALHIPTSVDYSKVEERFNVLRCFLEVLVKEDYDQTNNLLQWIGNSGAGVAISPILFINRIIASVGRSAIRILLPRNYSVESHKHGGARVRPEIIEELRGWNYLIGIWLGTEKDLLGKADYNLEQLSREYRDRVPLA